MCVDYKYKYLFDEDLAHNQYLFFTIVWIYKFVAISTLNTFASAICSSLTELIVKA